MARHMPFRFVWFRNHILHAWNKDTALGIDKLGHEVNKVGQGLVDHTSIHAGVEIPGRTCDGHFEIGDTA